MPRLTFGFSCSTSGPFLATDLGWMPPCVQFSLRVTRPFAHQAGLKGGKLNDVCAGGCCCAGSWCTMSAWGINTLRNSFRELAQFIGGGCVYAPGEVARVCGEKFVWLPQEEKCW